MILNKFKSIFLFIALCAGSGLLAMEPIQNKLNEQLNLAAVIGDMKKIKRLIKAGIQIDARYHSFTPLIHAAANGHKDICHLLIKNKAQIDARDNYGLTALIWAARNDHKDVCQLLIENKAIIDARDNYGLTALMCAARNGHKDICQLLIENKAQMDAKDSGGWTLLMREAGSEHKDTCRLLVDAMLKPVKFHQSTAIALLGIKKLRNVPCFKLIGRDVIQLIARPAFEHEKQKLYMQINGIASAKIKNELIEHAQMQLKSTRLNKKELIAPAQIHPQGIRKNNKSCIIF